MILLWLTRGRTWGFRFLIRGELADPLPVYDSAFNGLGDKSEVCRRMGDKVALRFVDPQGREDAAGRPIAHDFVLDGELAVEVNSLADGIRLVWPMVESEYSNAYSLEAPSSVGG